MRINQKIVAARLVFTIIALVYGTTAAFSQAVHDQIRNKLVYLHAKGQVLSGPNASNFVDSFASGALVSSDGLVLTVYHLISELGDVDPRTVTIEARIAEKTADVRPAAIVDAAINTDLMLLKLSPAANPYPAVALGSAVTHNDSNSIYTSGFPKNLDYRKLEGKVESRSGPGGYLWATSLRFNAGQSGSPVYNDQGEVIGIVKGDMDNIGFIIPIGYADALLAQIRLREIQDAMKDFDHLRKQFSWSGEIQGSKITISYEKSVSGEPHVKSIDLKIRPVGVKEGVEQKMTDFNLPGVEQTASIGQTGGAFEIPDLKNRIDRYRDEFDFSSISEVEIDIVPTLTDESVLRRKRIVIDYR